MVGLVRGILSIIMTIYLMYWGAAFLEGQKAINIKEGSLFIQTLQ